MSTRVLKKLQEANQSAELHDDLESNASENEENITNLAGKRRNFNPFCLLNEQNISDNEPAEDECDGENADATPNGAMNVSATKKRKKRQKKRAKAAEKPTTTIEDEFLDKNLNSSQGEHAKGSAASKQNAKYEARKEAAMRSLLCVELRNLNPQNEMRRTFGKNVVKMDNKRGRNKLPCKATHMVTSKESWPPIIKNMITMKPVSPPNDMESSTTSMDGTQWFTFEHSPNYQRIQNLFLSAVERLDSDFLINLIRRCPYHVDSLIQLSELCKMSEDYALGGEFIERALLMLESSMHPSFNLTSGNCRLDYRRQENRAFFIVLFKQAQYLEARACCRTAFELSKLVLNLNPDLDPLAMVLIIDYYALRSKQFEWMVKFYEEYNTVRNLSQLPNMAYSYALALFALHGECEQSDKALQDALFMFPGALRPLLEELSVKPDKRVLSASYFNSDVSSSQSPALNQLICLYVCRAKVVWRQTNVLPWMERNVNFVLDEIERNKDLTKEYNTLRAARYVTPPRPILRHVILSDYKEKVPLGIFITNEKQSIVAYDPLPPLDSINCYDRQPIANNLTTAATTATDNRPVMTFFQSMLPSFALYTEQANGVAIGALNADELQQRREHQARIEQNMAHVDNQLRELNLNNGIDGGIDGTVVGNSIRDLTQSVTNIVDAMRDFLQNFHVSPQNEMGLDGPNDSDDPPSDQNEDAGN